MQIKSVELKNIRSYLDEKIEFPEGSTLLSGDIGSGKSTILLSIDFALFGLRKGEISGDDLLRHGSNSGSVKVYMEIDGKDVLIERSLKRGKETISHDACYITVDEQRYDLTPVELKAKVLQLLGYSQELLKKNRPLFRFTVYTPQEQMKQILLYEDERLDILRNIFGIDRYGRIRNNSRIFLSELRLMKREYDVLSKDVENDRIMLEQITASKATIAHDLEQEKRKLVRIREDYDYKKSEVDAAKGDFNAMNLKKHELAKKEAELKLKKNRHEKIGSDIANTDLKLKKIREDVESIGEIPEISVLKTSLTEIQNFRDTFLSEKAVLKNDTTSLQSVYEKGVCTVCGQTVHDPDTFKKHIDEKVERIKEIESKLESFDEKMKKIRESVSNSEKLSHLKSSHNDLLVWKNENDIERETLMQEIMVLERDVENAKIITSDYDILYVKISKLEEELQNMQKERLLYEKNVSKYEQQIEDIEKRALDLIETIREKEGIREKSARISNITNWFEPFMGLTENIERHVMLALQRQFDEYFQKWFAILMGDTMNVRIDESFNPIIDQNGYETDYENLSGGEKTSVALAYRLALNKVINEMIENIKTRNILILDEPTDGFSTDQLDRIRDIINELNMRQIIIVSHEPKIDTYVDNVIKIYKEGHISRVA